MTEPDDRVPQGLTIGEVAERSGVSEADARRFWRALGFPDAGGVARFSDTDVTALTTLREAVESAGLDLDTGMRLARAVGQNVARMSDWQVAAIVSQVESTSPEVTEEEVAEGTSRATESVAAALEDVLVYAWQQHLASAVRRLDGASGEPAEVQSVTVGFADLVAFSALSNELDSARLGELVEIFESRCADVVAAHDGRMIKTLGDSVLFVADRAERAMDIAGGIVDVIGADRRLPDISIGLASGRVITKLGDVFGPPVNLAARLTALARRNRILVDPATVSRLPAEDYDFLPLTAREVRGFGLVEPVAVRRRR
jgi:adenylate cyclase